MNYVVKTNVTNRRTMLFYGVILLCCARIAAGLPAHAASATIIERQDDLLDEYDYIIAGGGTAGLTVADRLTESGNCTQIHYSWVT